MPLYKVSERKFSGHDAYYAEIGYSESDIFNLIYWIEFDEFAIEVEGRTGLVHEWGREQLESVLPHLKLHVYGVESDDPQDDDGVSWVTVIGALAAGGGALAIAAKALAARAKKKPKSDKDKKKERDDEEEAVGYILQISADKLVINEGQPVSLEATVWEVDSRGGTKKVPGAALAIEQPPNTNFLHIAPRRAQSTLQSNLSLVGKVTVPSLQLTVTGSANGSSSSAQVTVEFAAETYIEIQTDGNRRSLRADGKDGLLVYARVVTEGEKDEKILKDAQDSLEFAITGAGKSWIDPSDPHPQEEGEWRYIYIQASSPDGAGSGRQPPNDVQIKVSGQYKELKLSANVTINLLGEATLEYKPDKAGFLLGAGEKSEIKLWINPQGGNAWDFSCSWDEALLPIQPEFKDKEEHSATLVITECGEKDAEQTRHPGGLYANGMLRVFAKQGEVELEKQVSVGIYQEGLFVDTAGRTRDGTFHLTADGKQEPRLIDFRILMWNAESRKLEANPDMGLDLKFNSMVTNEETANAMEVGQLYIESQGMVFERSGMAAERYRFWIENELPVDGRVLRAKYLAETSEFNAEFILGVETTAMPVFERQLEMQRCQYVINKFVPGDYQLKMQEIFDKRAPVLGPEGLYQLRLQIWKIAQNLILGEGGQGYLEEGKWAGRIESVLEWTQWAGNHCFDSLVVLYLGPTGRKWAPFVRNLMIDCINAGIYEKKTPPEWAYGYVHHILGQLQDIRAIISTVKDEAKTRGLGWLQKELENRQIVIVGGSWRIVIPGWAAFKIIKSVTRFMELYCEGKSLYEAAKLTAWEASDDVIGSYLTDLVGKKGNQNFMDVLSSEIEGSREESLAKNQIGQAMDDIMEGYKESGWTEEDDQPDGKTKKYLKSQKPQTLNLNDEDPKYREAVKKIKAATKMVDGKLVADKKVVQEIMEDWDATRSLKNAPKDVREAFSNARNEIYSKHDAELVSWAQKNLPQYKGKKIGVGDFRTPTADGVDMGTDRDYRLGYWEKDPRDGKEKFIEIEEGLYKSKSYQIFAEVAEDRPFSTQEATIYAEGKGQLACTGVSKEACAGFPEQGSVWMNERGEIVDPRDYVGTNEKLTPKKWNVGSNIKKVHAGEAKLKDAQGLGSLYELKVHESLEKGFRADAYGQAAKSIEQLNGIMVGGKDKYHFGKKGIDPKVQNVMNEVLKAKSANFNSKALDNIDKLIKDSKLGNNIADFEKYINGNLESMKFATKKK